MASTFTTSLKFNKPALGDAGWGTAVNGGFTDLVDQALGGQASIDVGSGPGPFVLTIPDGASGDARNMFIRATGTPGGAREIQVPINRKLYFVTNDSDGAVTVKVSGQTGVVVPVGASMALRINAAGTDVVVAQDQFVDLTASGNVTVAGATTLAALTASGNVSFDGGTFVFNESGADKDARFEGDTDANLLFLDASTDRVGIGTATPGAKLDVNGPASVTSFTGATRLGVTVKGSTTATDYSGIDFSGNNQIVPTARIAVLTESGGSSLVFGTSNNYATGITNSALVIDFSGNVGIGTSSPAVVLHVKSANGVIWSETTAARNSNNNYLSFRDPSGEAGYVGYGASDSRFYIWNNLSDDTLFGTDNAERMRIDSSGRVGINGAAPSDSRLYAKNVTDASFAATFENTSALGYGISIGSDSSILAYFYPNGTRSGSPVGSISCTPTTTSYNQSSDRRLKTAVAPATDAGTLLDAVQVVEFDWKVGGHVRYGVIAQDLHLLAPEAVTPGDSNEEVERPWGVDYSKLVPMLIKEVQSLRARVAALEAK